MAAERKGHIFLDRQGIVERRLLKQKADLFSDFIQLSHRKSRNLLAMHLNRARIRRLKPHHEFQEHAFACAAPPEDGDGFAGRQFQVDTIQNVRPVERFLQALHGNSWAWILYSLGRDARDCAPLLSHHIHCGKIT
jgi:hypothetical protein